ncbi:hypothetical protein QZH41_011174 [Actinostola sp. cb2023]|nr:hypothetical protein QZH41_011174 [Actinostola sp. cb2023]
MTEDDILFMELEAAVKKEFEDNLPGGWVLSHSKKHDRTYYFNTVTGESRWMHPLIPDDGAQEKGSESSCTLSDFTMPTREKPITHTASDPILCGNILRRGAHINDRDGLTDMTLLHYSCKAGAVGVGDVTSSVAVVSELIAKGVDVSLRCHWTDMLPLHYAAFFDIAPVMEILLTASNAKDVNARCKEFDNGTALHISSSNLCIDAVKCLLNHGANVTLRDKLSRLALDCVPNVAVYEAQSEPAVTASTLMQLLTEAEPPAKSSQDQENSSLAALGIKLGDRVLVGGTKDGILRFCGLTEFSSGEWAGVELDEPVGKNDGSVSGVEYFQCRPNRGIFAPISKITKDDSRSSSSSLPVSAKHRPQAHQSYASSLPGSKTTSRTTSRTNSRSSSPSPHDVDEAEIAEKFELGDRVLVAGQKAGHIQYIGETQFASGWWLGVELDQPVGKNDGSVGGVRYFTCKPRFGVFAPVTKVKK